MDKIAVPAQAEPLRRAAAARQRPVRNEAQRRHLRAAGQPVPHSGFQVSHHDPLDPVLSQDLVHRGPQQHRDAVRLDARPAVPGQTAQGGPLLNDGCHPFPRLDKLPGHDLAHVAAAQNHNVVPYVVMTQVGQPLGLTGGVDPLGPGPRHGQGVDRPLPAPCGQDTPPERRPLQPGPAGEQGGPVQPQLQHRDPSTDADAGALHPLNQPPGVGGAGEALANPPVKALAQYAAQRPLRLRQKDAAAPLRGRQRGGQTCRAAANHQNITTNHPLRPSAPGPPGHTGSPDSSPCPPRSCASRPPLWRPPV